MLRFFLAERLGVAFGVVVDVQDSDRARQDYLAGTAPGVVVNQKNQYHGPAGMVGLAKAAPDGHTLAFAVASPMALAFCLGKAPYDPAKDFVPVASLFAAPVLLLATPALSRQDAPDFPALLARAKQKPGAIRWATMGDMPLGHLILEQIKAAAGVNIEQAPHPSGESVLSDALAGEFELLAISAGPIVIGSIRSGRLRPLAVSAPVRVKEQLASVPTLAELGLPGANLSSVFGFFAPAGTSPEIVQKFNQTVNAQSHDAELRHHIDAEGLVAIGGSPADFVRIITETEGYIRVALQATK
jgi:tripartite-type tricarboxylate transporter receptor subunit TctC